MARRSLKYLLNRYTLSFRNRIVVIAVGMVICLLSLVYTNRMAHDLREKEQHDVEVWAHARGKRQADAEISNPPWRAQQWNAQPGAFPKQGQTPHE